ncbi:MAG: ATP-binding cassette domain-containing protein, partial [Bacteroidetes bacterium]|nr:ATP-binding cassette domain-containing protein [Bacteroidota bacterium]
MNFRIELDACGKSFLDHWVFRSRNLQLNSGERVALLGPNGSGKSTLMLLICGYLQPTEGKVSYALNGKPIPNEHIGAHISMCLPNMETFEEFTLLQLIHLHTSMRRMLCSSNADDIIDILKFSSNEAKRQIRFFSNGMRQRL